MLNAVYVFYIIFDHQSSIGPLPLDIICCWAWIEYAHIENTKDMIYLQIFTNIKTGYEYYIYGSYFCSLIFRSIEAQVNLYETIYCLLMYCNGKLSKN